MKPTTARIRRGLEELHAAIYRERVALHDLRMLPLGKAHPPQETPIPIGDEPGWRPIAVGDFWGGQDENAWFHGEATIPPQWRDGSAEENTFVLRFLLGVSPDFGWPEGLLYANGQLLQGINQFHVDVWLPDNLMRAEALRFDVRAWSGMTNHAHSLRAAELARLDRDTEALYHLFRAGCDLVDAIDTNDPLIYPLSQVLESAYDDLDLWQPGSVSSTLATVRAQLARLREAYTPEARPSITMIGHGHLDVAWLWQTRHTREKAARTFSIATALMERYPEYHFLHSTPQVFAWLAQDYPTVFARAQSRIAEGRFEAAGAIWVESDTNIVSGESLVRQIFYGQRYLRETFGQEYDVLWLPDTFGYTYALPQIMLRSGLRVFMTTKMSWSDTNRLPHDTFRWRGLDGSEVLAHFVTTPWLPINPSFNSDTYNARLDVPSVRQLWERYRDKSVNQDLLLIYGHGDGGAGPTRQHIESYRAMRELPGLPELHLGRADSFFRALHERVWKQPDLPTWDGELYLEFHRGVYTSHSSLKRLHRRIEDKLLLAETLDATRWAQAPHATYPDERPMLDTAWRELLMHEFHDILPGSSIGPVYEDAQTILGALSTRLDEFIAQAENEIATHNGSDQSWLIHNPSPCATPGEMALAMLPLTADGDVPAFLAEDYPLLTQTVTDLDGARRLLVETPAIPGRGWLTLDSVTPPTKAHKRPTASLAIAVSETDESGVVLENDLYRCALDANGEMASLLDKRVAGGRELIQQGERGNQLVVFDDRPRRFGSWDFDAWDLDETYNRKSYALTPAEITITERGPLRVTARVRRRFQNSVIEQDISLYRDLPRIDFATRIEWRDHHFLLKAAFPLDLRVTHARSEIQYGSISRPTHTNTSWDTARFETVAHRWVDLSETGYGVALLNDGRYGHDIHGAVIRISLLRSPTTPDPNADQGVQELTYSLLPHPGAWPSGEVVAHGYMLNRPLRLIAPQRKRKASSAQSTPQPLFWVETGAVVVEAVKRASEGDELIVRMYEPWGSRTKVAVRCSLPVERVIETDLLERPLTAEASPAYPAWLESRAASHDAPEAREDGWSCHFRPFEIRTFRVTTRRT